MKANPDKCHSICITDGKVNIIFGNQKINSSLYEKLLGVRFDSKLPLMLVLYALWVRDSLRRKYWKNKIDENYTFLLVLFNNKNA